MIYYIKGLLEHISEGSAVVETGGIAYEIQIPASTAARLPALGSSVKIYTYLDVKDTGVSLFGFITKEEKEIFLKLITVNGIGPKGALGILSVLTPSDIILSVVSGDEKTLSRAPGIGKKTAQRIIIDLKDKFKSMSAEDVTHSIYDLPASDNSPKSEAVSALCALGYTNSEALKAVSQVQGENLATEDILREALKKLNLF